MPGRPVIALRSATDADVDDFLAIVTSEGVREWWGDVSDEEKLRSDLLDDECTVFAVEVDGATAGWLQSWEEDEPAYRYAGLDIMLAVPYQDRGIGPEALRLAIRRLIDEQGHHRFTIDPALSNERAIRAYEKVGFQRVGVLRRYWRDANGEWRDGLVMDLLADELTG
jgi:aminoglycoside 6'-N-acetyltransferase